MQKAIIAATALIALSQIPSAAEEPVNDRPSRPRNPAALAQLNGRPVRPSLTDVQSSVAKVKMKERAERDLQKPTTTELRLDARTQVAEIKTETLIKFQDLLESVKSAQEKAKEQARKLADEAKDAAKERGRGERPPI